MGTPLGWCLKGNGNEASHAFACLFVEWDGSRLICACVSLVPCKVLSVTVSLDEFGLAMQAARQCIPSGSRVRAATLGLAVFVWQVFK